MPAKYGLASASVAESPLRADTERRASQLTALLIAYCNLPQLQESGRKLTPYFLGELAALNEQGFKGTPCDAHTLDGVIHALAEAIAYTQRQGNWTETEVAS
jgi:hypothetical protein